MTWEIREGDALERLAELEAESVQCVITSPPYYGLRDYGTGEWEGGDPECDHKRAVSLTASSGLRRDGREHAGPYEGEKAIEASARPYMSECRRCGARRSDRQIGLEQTPEEYVERLVAVFREVRRVLRDDGTLWLNIGDSYTSGNRTWRAPDKKNRIRAMDERLPTPEGLKPKDLLGIPWMLAFALRADGWWLRSEVIWSKPNPMPESVQDRPTRAHEQIFLLTKLPRYFYDAEAIKEDAQDWSRGGPGAGIADTSERYGAGNGGNDGLAALAVKYRTVRPGVDTRGGGQGTGAMEWDPRRRNKRSVWTVPTRPYADAHFATFPPDLIEPCVLAGSSPQACGKCGAPRRRVTEREDQGYDGSRYGERAVAATGGATSGGTERSTLGSSNGTKTGQQRTLCWEPTCAHALEADESGRCTVLDPFAGSGTVGVVCEWYGRDFIGLELSPAYAEMARRRIESEGRLGRPASRPRETDGDQLALL